MKHLHYKREKLIDSYRNLSSLCEIIIEKYSSCYSRTGSSEVFEAISEIKFFQAEIMKYPVFNESIKELRLWLECEDADIKYFETIVNTYKLKIEDYIRIISDIKDQNVNSIIKRKEILIAEGALATPSAEVRELK